VVSRGGHHRRHRELLLAIVAGFMLARRVRGRRDDAIQREVDRQLAERK